MTSKEKNVCAMKQVSRNIKNYFPNLLPVSIASKIFIVYSILTMWLDGLILKHRQLDSYKPPFCSTHFMYKPTYKSKVLENKLLHPMWDSQIKFSQILTSHWAFRYANGAKRAAKPELLVLDTHLTAMRLWIIES